jgi:hypothetical protein
VRVLAPLPAAEKNDALSVYVTTLAGQAPARRIRLTAMRERRVTWGLIGVLIGVLIEISGAPG